MRWNGPFPDVPKAHAFHAFGEIRENGWILSDEGLSNTSGWCVDNFSSAELFNQLHSKIIYSNEIAHVKVQTGNIKARAENIPLQSFDLLNTNPLKTMWSWYRSLMLYITKHAHMRTTHTSSNSLWRSHHARLLLLVVCIVPSGSSPPWYPRMCSSRWSFRQNPWDPRLKQRGHKQSIVGELWTDSLCRLRSAFLDTVLFRPFFS